MDLLVQIILYIFSSSITNAHHLHMQDSKHKKLTAFLIFNVTGLSQDVKY